MTIYDRQGFRVGSRFTLTPAEIGKLEALQSTLDDAGHELAAGLDQRNIVRIRRALKTCATVAAKVEEFKAIFESSPTSGVVG